LNISVPTILNTSLTVETGDEPESKEQTDIDQIESEELAETNPKIEAQDLSSRVPRLSDTRYSAK